MALAAGLLMTWIVILFLPAEQARFAPEHAALMRAIAAAVAAQVNEQPVDVLALAGRGRPDVLAEVRAPGSSIAGGR
ncbi:MAG: hypothetical protein E6K24_08795 [Gammaproteobacteria bacterium]|nr:MAG: hypothetical protein E6K24_08795 [Gammaproteobacteria bacterium]